MDKMINLRGQQIPEVQATVNKATGGNKTVGIFLAVTALIIGIFVGKMFFSSNDKQNSTSSIFETKKNFVNSSKYQAVILTTGQTYFGKVSGENDQYVSLTDVYYLAKNTNQSVADASTTTDKKKEKPAPETPASDYTLQKLGTEVHGPENMYLNRDQIVMIENLRDDSKVVSAIKNQETKK